MSIAKAPTARAQVKRLPKRGRYDPATIYGILDRGLFCHVGFLFDNLPAVIPTLYWREGDRIYWHGSAQSRMLRSVENAPVCVAVTQFDGLVLARSAFHHSANYRSVTLYGTATPVTDAAEKRMRLKAMVDSITPERWDRLRPVTQKELNATRLMWITIDEASAKIRQGPPNDHQDFGWPVWAGVIPFSTTMGTPECDQGSETAGEPVPFALRPR